MPQIAIAGVTGYAGMELARLLLHHPRLKTASPILVGREAGTLAATHPQFTGSALPIVPFAWQLLADRNVEVLLLATPHEQSRAWVPEALARGIKVIDLSGAWRLNSEANRAVYAFEDEGTPEAVATQQDSLYGMPELHREAIRKASLVANPGCYSTSIILALHPLVKAGLLDLDHGIICDSKSGVSGAGKAPTAKTHFMYAADNLSAYALFHHRHTGELLEQLDLAPEQIVFTPHLLPIPRGILSTIYVRFQRPATVERIAACFQEAYAASPLVRIFPQGQLPQIQYVAHTNYCDIGFQLSPDGTRAVIISCLDNLLKGAAGQAVQNLNLICGWNEAEGLL